MAEMAQGSLPLSDIQNHVDMDEESAWLRFRCRGESVHIDCEFQDDWVDPNLFGHFVDLLAKCDPRKVFIYQDLDGQDCIIGCVNRDQFAALKKLIPTMKLLS